MNCVFCEIGTIYPEAPAGLCVSCAYAVRFNDLVPKADARGNLYLVWRSATPDNPLGYEGTDPGTLYEPYRLAESAADAAELSAQLLTLHYWTATGTVREVARTVIDAIRGFGCDLAISPQWGRAEISNVRRIPYTLLVRFVELQTEIEDELSRERAAELLADWESRRAAYELLANRFGHEHARAETGFVQHEHFAPLKGSEGSADGDKKEIGRDVPSDPNSDGAHLRLDRLPHAG